ncbi:hypothetical protein NQ176_g8667 [Zarea fungicola]|uniref:Uncharacterized protein n=1 Tax=Zarea fungicola TaxID=93591 RepID=A0ACC1MRU5_9HYPO|nr:hypothetical protein NQ176_g8667 [Lecanicillium fungicola]
MPYNMLDDNTPDDNGAPYPSSWATTSSPTQTIIVSTTSTMEPGGARAATIDAAEPQLDGPDAHHTVPVEVAAWDDSSSGFAVQTVNPEDLIRHSAGPCLHESTIEERLARIYQLENVPVVSSAGSLALEAEPMEHTFTAPDTPHPPEVVELPTAASPATALGADGLLAYLDDVVASASQTAALATNLAAIVRASPEQVPSMSWAHSDASSDPEPRPVAQMLASTEHSVATGSSASSPRAAIADTRFQCHRCPNTFSRPDAVKRHIRNVHDRITLPCLVAGCMRSFQRPDQVRHHLRTHH